MIRQTVYYSGRVQGVGFRYTAVRLAKKLAIRGYAKDMLNGQVELVAEGAEHEVEGFLNALRESMCLHIESENQRKGLATGEFEDFQAKLEPGGSTLHTVRQLARGKLSKVSVVASLIFDADHEEPNLIAHLVPEHLLDEIRIASCGKPDFGSEEILVVTPIGVPFEPLWESGAKRWQDYFQSGVPIMIRQTVYYTGRVQGVGFRFTASHIARGFAVKGFVRNLADGRVELVAEGERQEVRKFLTALFENMEANIKNVDSDEGAATGEFSAFLIEK